MKRLVIAVIVLAAIAGGIALKPKTIEYIAPEPIEVVKEVTVNPLDEKIKQRENELEEKYTKIKSLEARLDVLKAERARLDDEIKGLQKDLAGFIQPQKSNE